MAQATAPDGVSIRSQTGSLRLPTSLGWSVVLPAGALVILSVALFAEPFFRLVEMREGNVYHHVEDAQRLAATHVLYPGHFLYHLLTVAMHGIIPLSWLQAHLVSVLALRALLAVTVWWLMRRSLGARDSINGALLAIALTLGLLFASALSFVTWGVGNYYIGYVVPNVYVSQTMVALQPVALLAFFAVIRVLDAPWPGPSWREVLAMAALVVLSALAKPSFAMVLVPAVAALLLVRHQLLRVIPIRRVGFLVVPGRWCRDAKSVAILGFGLVIPALAAIAWVYASTYLAVQKLALGEGSGVRIAPFSVMAYLQSSYVSPEHVAFWLVVKVVLSLVFPAAVAIVFFRHVRDDLRFQLAWFQLAFGLIFAYFFAEEPRFTAGNFTWSAQIALFILFVVSTLLLVEQTLAGRSHRWRSLCARPAALLCYAALLLHVAAGYGIYMHPAVT